jgi:Na+-driven multidrug efflux pump
MLMSAAAAMNIAIDPVLIFGLFGFPRMELEGAALGGVIANFLTMCASIFFVMHRERLVNIRTLDTHLMMDSWRRILHVGLPSLTSSLVAPVTTAFITYQIATFGQTAVAGFGLASRIEGLSLLAMMALSAAMTPFVGQNFGARRLDRVGEGIRFAYRFSLFYGLAIGAFMLLFGGFIVDLFGVEGQARDTALLHMHVVPVSYIALGCAMTVNGSLNALGKPVAAMWISMSRTIAVYAPLAWLLSQWLGLVGIFIAAASANAIAGGIGVYWLRLVYREAVADKPVTTRPA